MASPQEQERCAHPACSCKRVPGSKYCSDYCRRAGDVTELRCGCGHPECR